MRSVSLFIPTLVKVHLITLFSALMVIITQTSFPPDIDECSVSNKGGCSHKCVNTPGGYKCTCPDPELSLSSDKKTCHGKY